MLYNSLVHIYKKNFCVLKTLNPTRPMGKLSIIPTPIGNLSDLTPNIIKSLFKADLIACQDRRVAGQLYTLIKNRNIIPAMETQFGTLGLSNIIPYDQSLLSKDTTNQQHLFYNYSNMGDKQRRKLLSKMSLQEEKIFKIQYLKYRAKKIVKKNQEFTYKGKPDKFDELYGIQVSDFKHIQSQIINTRSKKNRGLLIPINTYSQTKMFDLVKHLLQTRHIALVSDAGMPCISDPGWKMIQMIRQSMPDVEIQVVGGPSSVDILLNLAKITSRGNTLSGRFEGFASPVVSNITEESIKLNRNLYLAKQKDFSIHFINSRKLSKQTYEMERIYGEKHQIVVTNQLTKKFERKFHGTIKELMQLITKQGEQWNLRGQMSYLLYSDQNILQSKQIKEEKNTIIKSQKDQDIHNINLSVNIKKFISVLNQQSKLKSKQISQMTATIFGIKHNIAKKLVYNQLKQYAK